MAGADDIHGAENDTSPFLMPAHHDTLDAGGDALPASLSAPFSFLAVYKPISRQVRIYPIGLDAPFDGPIDLNEAAAHSLLAELRAALGAPELASQLLGGRAP